MNLSPRILARVRGPILALAASGCGLSLASGAAPEPAAPLAARAPAELDAVADAIAYDAVAYDASAEGERLAQRDHDVSRETDRRDRRVSDLRQAQRVRPTPVAWTPPPMGNPFMFEDVVACGRG